MKLHHESDPLFFVADPSKKEPDGCAIPHATYEPESVRRRPMAAQTCRQAAHSKPVPSCVLRFSSGR